jgi:beta-galactosidase
VSGGADGDIGGGLRFSRRSLLRAGVLGAAALTGGAIRRPASARAAEAGSASSALGVYEFNQDWLFGGVYAGGAEAPGHPDSGFAAITLPHTVTPLSWGDWDASTWQQVWIYRKHLVGPANAGTRVFVDFQGVMTSASVFLGGTQIAQHPGGYLPFSVELTQHLVAGDNVLAVVVDGRWLDVPPDGAAAGASAVDYLQPSGIYRDVALRIVPAIHISDVFAKPTNVLSASPGADVQLIIDAGAATGQVAISAAVLDGGRMLGSASDTTSVTSTGIATVTLSVGGLSGITLWSPDTPKLYLVTATLVANGVTHSFDVNIGFREATFATDGFHLNGQRLEIFGLNRHQLFPYTGMAAPARLQRRDAEILRTELNCNMVRCSHYPQSPDFLDACDELGLMVWEEPPGWQYIGDAAFQDIVLQNVGDMVTRDRNRPSVIIWATRLNETANNTTLYAQTRALADSLDGTRQTSGAMSLYSTSGWAQDVFAYDDYHSINNSNTDATLLAPLAGVPYLVSEAVGALDGAPLYRWVDTDATLALQAKMHAQVHNLAGANAAYSGLLGWAGIDYASLNGGARIWHNLKWAGVLDTFRVPKPGAAFYRSQVNPTVEAVILPVFFWDFGSGSPATGPGAVAMIATNCDSLELYFDGVHHVTGTPDTTDYASLAHPPVIVDLTVTGTAPTELRIDGYVGANLVASVEMSADTTRDRLALTVEDASLVGDGSDMTRFTFRALDAYGNQRPYPTGDVALTLAGPATLIAQNPFAFAEYGGVGGGFIRSVAGTTGTVTVTATHPTLGTASGTLTVTPQPPRAPGGAPTAVASTVPPPPRPVTKPKAKPAGPSRARVRSALGGLLSPHGSAARIAKLLKRGGYTFRFDAPSSGKLVIDWDYAPPRKRHARKPKPVRIAARTVSVKKAGRISVTVKLTKAGRRLLKRAKRERLTVRVSFTPIGQSTTTRTRVIELKR